MEDFRVFPEKPEVKQASNNQNDKDINMKIDKYIVTLGNQLK